MNFYPGIDKALTDSVLRHAVKLQTLLNHKIDLQDLQQDLIFDAITALDKYDVQKGSIKEFVSGELKIASAQIVRKHSAQKRITALKSVNAESIDVADPQCNPDERIDLDMVLDMLPKSISTAISNGSYSLKRRNIQIIQKIIAHRKGGTMKNISCLEVLSTQELTKLPESDLLVLQAKLAEAKDWFNKIKTKFEDAVEAKYRAKAKEELSKAGKDFGSVSWKTGGVKISVDHPKKVQWDQQKLAFVYSKMDPEAREEIFTVNYSISEKQYAKLESNVKKDIDDARVLALGKPKISIEKGE